jgi:RNA-binding protein YlmH
MFDEDKLLNHLHREEDRLLGSHILDKCEQVLKYHKTQATDFLNPYQIEIAEPLIEQIAEINFKKEGEKALHYLQTLNFKNVIHE